MKKRLITGTCFVLVIALALILKFKVSNYFFDMLILAVACIASYEASKLFTKMGRYNDKIMAISFPVISMIVLLLCIANDKDIGIVFTIVILIATMLVFFAITFLISLLNRKVTKTEMRARENELTITKYSLIKALNTTLVFIYPVFLLLFLTFINHIEDMTTSFGAVSGLGGRLSLFILIFTLLIPIFSDTFAYLTGGIFGGKKVAPKVSPNKTISGCVGGLVWCVLLSITFFCICNSIPSMAQVLSATGITLWKVALISVFGSVISQLGDLFESFLKREAGVKDAGKILPGHGGMLDRFDSHIFVAPYIFIAFSLLLILL